MITGIFYGAPGGIRTPDPRFRRPMLYPAELLVRKCFMVVVIKRAAIPDNPFNIFTFLFQSNLFFISDPFLPVDQEWSCNEH